MNTNRNKFISEHLNRINWIFFDLSHPGNLGASARALKVMGASNIILVNPVKEKLAEDDVAIRRAAGAKDLLATCVETTFEQATESSNCVIAFSSRKREIQPSLIEFNTMISKVVQLLIFSDDSRVSMVFGGERVGLQNKDLIKCSHLCTFDVSDIYSSLNLSHSVQLVVYALRSELTRLSNIFLKTSLDKNRVDDTNELNSNTLCIPQKKIFDLKKSFLELSNEIGLIKSEKKGRLEERISRILLASNLSENDFRLLHSFFGLIKKNLKDKS
jgi:TrmH family RNA methyltransferase